MYLDYHTRWDGRGVPVILTFVYATAAAAELGATPDGRHAGKVVAQGVTPHSASMTEGVTAAINSCTKIVHLVGLTIHRLQSIPMIFKKKK